MCIVNDYLYFCCTWSSVYSVGHRGVVDVLIRMIHNIFGFYNLSLDDFYPHIILYLRWKTAEREHIYIYYMETSVVLSYKNTLGYVNNNMFTSAIRKINKRRDPCQVLRTTTRHVSVLISINALSPAPRGSTTPRRRLDPPHTHRGLMLRRRRGMNSG